MISRNARLFFPRVSLQQYRCGSKLVSQFDETAQSSPHREAVRYTNKNIKWTASEFKNQVDWHANALLETGFRTGESVVIWHKDSPEKHVTLLAAAKIGLRVWDLDTSVDSVSDLRKALNLSNCKAIIFEPQTESQDNLKLLRKSIPEFFSYDDTYGQRFHSKFFPELEHFIHTGFDIELGCMNFKTLFVPHGENYLAAVTPTLNDSLPLYIRISKGPNGVEASAPLSQQQVLEGNELAWAFARKLVNKQYFEL